MKRGKTLPLDATGLVVGLSRQDYTLTNAPNNRGAGEGSVGRGRAGGRRDGGKPEGEGQLWASVHQRCSLAPHMASSECKHAHAGAHWRRLRHRRASSGYRVCSSSSYMLFLSPPFSSNLSHPLFYFLHLYLTSPPPHPVF